jgi:glutathione synthase/RimK-type ligase-like ATP-grasp enzyme
MICFKEIKFLGFRLMANRIKKIYIGVLCNRDLSILSEIKQNLTKNYNITLINLLKPNSDNFDKRYFEKKLKKYPISYLILKLTSQKSNKEIYENIRKNASNIPILNSIESVKTCESRNDIFTFMNIKCKKLLIPRWFQTKTDAIQALNNSKEIIIKLDSHNIPDLPKNDRIIGIAKNLSDFHRITKNYSDGELFFQEFLGRHDILYKVYVIGQWAVSITSHNRLNEYSNLTPLELVHIRVPIEEQFKKRILRLGRKFGMPIFGLDYIMTQNGPYIVDINDFPSFRSIPEGVSLISDFIYNEISSREGFSRALMRAKS